MLVGRCAHAPTTIWDMQRTSQTHRVVASTGTHERLKHRRRHRMFAPGRLATAVEPSWLCAKCVRETFPACTRALARRSRLRSDKMVNEHPLAVSRTRSQTMNRAYELMFYPTDVTAREERERHE